jgi:transcriptional regulator with XRE-family HTH domain/tetratricopeptide (TPR) repeat protein
MDNSTAGGEIPNKKLPPNERLKHEREMRGWSQSDVAEEVGTDQKVVSRWERGISRPSPYFRRKLCERFGKDARELGLIDELDDVETSLAPQEALSAHPPGISNVSSEKRNTSLLVDAGGYNSASSPEDTLLSERGEPLAVVQGAPLVHIRAHQSIDLLRNTSGATPERQLGVLLALEANNLAMFFDEGWSVDELLESLRAILPGAQAMSKITRRTFGRKLLQFGAAAVVSGISIPEGRHISVEDRTKLHSALGKSIAAGWKLFHTAGNSQVLAVGQAQLYLVQQNHALLYPSMQPLYYSAVYRLIGAAQHFQGRYVEAYQAHETAYIAALEGADAWNMAQSRSWQAYGLMKRENYLEALQMADAALRLVSHQMDTESIRLRARLLAFSAENAALLGNEGEVQARLDSSQELLEHLPGYHEEFDQVSWLQQAGTCALNLKQYDVAVTRLQQAFDQLPAQWTLRAVSTALPLASALTRQKELNRALALIKKTLPLVRASQSPTLIQEFADYLQTELLASYPHDRGCQTFVAEAQQQLTIA